MATWRGYENKAGKTRANSCGIGYGVGPIVWWGGGAEELPPWARDRNNNT